MYRNKPKMLNFRVSQEDFEQIHNQAEKAGLSLSAYLLTMALKGQVTVVQGLPQIATELRKVGNNLNQLTRLCHEGKITCLELNNIKNLLEGIWQLLNSLTRKAV